MSACVACGSDERRPAASMRNTTVVRCAGCGLVRCDPLPRFHSPSSGESSILTEEAFTAHMVSGSPRRAQRYRALANARYHHYAATLGRANFRMLEVGCGEAGMAAEMAARGAEYHGIDIDPRPIAVAHSRGIESCRVGDILSCDEDGRYDVVFMSQVLEHITRPRDLLEKVSALLAPDGILHLDVPNHDGLAGMPSRAVGGIGNRFGAIDWPHHSIAYDRRSLVRLLGPRFAVRAFTATPDDPLWGQAVVPTITTRLYYAATRVLRARSLLVAFCRPLG
ncbi:class I SAM-dependent methyltransferase [Actinoplanes sp. NPDC024001]|uniref:class I SAM-dependent methyltransferase n=1 Tax=Actinoplanes sp. NPDC024001 TaxID=3154598 RepID=UPI00340C9F71